MKTNKSILGLLLCLFFSLATFAQTFSISQEEALTIAQRQFQDRDVDYYLLLDNNDSAWTIFVDAEPMKGWEHECYLLPIPKSITVPLSQYTPSSEKRNFPPETDMLPLSVTNRFGANSDEKPQIMNTVITYDDAKVANHTYAVILSGGGNKNSNHERYWNDCSFLFQVLTKTYGIPQSNINVIMSDGTDPAEDMRTVSGYYTSSPLDLDGDRTNDIQYAATKNNIVSVLSQLNDKMEQDDHLLFFVIDHGGSLYYNKSYICLWNDDVLYDNELASYLAPLQSKGITTNVVLGQCFSGGFIEELSEIGCIVATACTGNQSSYSCANMLYDEFVYHWTSAINGEDTHGNIVKADSDMDGKISMYEAFASAKLYDAAEETPQFFAGKYSEGKFLSFKSLPKSDDIYIKDNPFDRGDEPNLTTDDFWASPSICVRNNRDNIFIHENPVYSDDHEIAYIYVRVYNRGKKFYRGGDFIHMYWAKASTGLNRNVWRGRETENGKQTGGSMECMKIDTIRPGEYRDVEVKWLLPTMMEHDTVGEYHYCLYGKIQKTTSDDPIEQTTFNPQNSKKEAQKNVMIIRKEDVNKTFNVYVRNINNSSSSYSLELKPHRFKDLTLFNKANLELQMSPIVYSAWERGGFKGEDIEPVVTARSSNGGRNAVKLLSAYSKLQDVQMLSNEFDIVSLKFDFKIIDSQSETYEYDLIQKDESGNIIGGERFIVESPCFTVIPIDIIKKPTDDGKIQLTVASDTDFAALNWYNDSGENIGTTETITVNPTQGDKNVSVVAFTENGEATSASASLETLNGIESVSLNSHELYIKFKNDTLKGSFVELVSTSTGKIMANKLLSEGEKDVAVDISSVPAGLYIVRYVTDKVVIDTTTVAIQK